VTARGLLRTGIAGTVITAVCCFTPVLVVALGAVGLSAWLGWLDEVLFPLLAVFVGLTALAVYRLRRAARPGGRCHAGDQDGG
jgi:mercuric ion transport protein